MTMRVVVAAAAIKSTEMAASSTRPGSAREGVARNHIDALNAGGLNNALLSFKHARLELAATDEVIDGPDDVMAGWMALRRAFPDLLIETVTLHDAGSSVVVEAVARGTHTGGFRGLPPTGRRVELPLAGIFVFEGGGLVCLRVFFDTTTFLQQLGAARDPLSLGGRLGTVAAHPLRISRGIVRRVTGR